MSEEMTPIRKNPKKALGRGLGSLLGEASTMSDPNDFQRVETVAKAPAPQKAAPPPPPVAAQKPPLAPAPPASSATVVAATQAAVRQSVSPSTPPPVKATAPTPPPSAPQAAAPTVASQPVAPTVPPQDRVWKVAIEKVLPNKEQPRKTFDPAKLQELANSLKEKGILLPILVRPLANQTFEIIAGERRWRAAQLAGMQEVPVLVRKTENREVLELALIENIQRQDINPIEEAEAYGILATRYALTQQQIAEKVSKDRSTVANLMRLMALAPEVKEMMKSGELQLGQAKVLLSLAEPGQQTSVAKKVVKQKLSVRATERLVAKIKEQPESDFELDDEVDIAHRREIQALSTELQKILGTKVELDLSGQRSKISIHFYSVPELNQFVDRIRKL